MLPAPHRHAITFIRNADRNRASAPLILAVVALAAVWIPGVRASRVDPIRALRTE
ncbi:MAG TPA: hypothetical protein VL967_04010 [Terracidiphilus sp.]|nr:hypothetical protein [Terracidiphilus sp.]